MVDVLWKMVEVKTRISPTSDVKFARNCILVFSISILVAWAYLNLRVLLKLLSCFNYVVVNGIVVVNAKLRDDVYFPCFFINILHGISYFIYSTTPMKNFFFKIEAFNFKIKLVRNFVLYSIYWIFTKPMKYFLTNDIIKINIKNGNALNVLKRPSVNRLITYRSK